MEIIKNQNNTIYFWMLDNAGQPAIGCESDAPNSEISMDGGTLTYCANEINAVGGGLYSLILTSNECNCDALALKISVETATTHPYCAVLYPVSMSRADALADIRSDTNEVRVSLAPGGVTGNALSGIAGEVDGLIDKVNAIPTDNFSCTLSAAGVDAILDETSVDGTSLRQVIDICTALVGCSKTSGSGTSQITVRDVGDTRDFITIGVDENGNRKDVSISWGE